MSRPRLHLACDQCAAAAWIGPRRGESGHDAWCEACQLAQPAVHTEARCTRCGGALTTDAPRFAELWGALQEADAVLAAWQGDPTPLRTLLPERPRFLSDLAPPAIMDDEPVTALVHHGDYAAALLAPTPHATQGWAALAIARERRGDPGGAIEAWDQVLAAGDAADHAARAHLARGSLRARARAWDAAAADLAHAGDGFEARWDRAAMRVHRAVERTPGLPDARLIEDAQAEVGEVSAYWSDPTIARLLWTLLVERAVARQAAPRADGPDARVLRAAESFFEFDTFWDRAMMLAGWARLGIAREAARHAAPLAEAHLHALALEPPMRGAALAPAAAALEQARAAIVRREPAEARRALAQLLAREDLQRYRVPCAACGKGTVGVDTVEDREPFEE